MGKSGIHKLSLCFGDKQIFRKHSILVAEGEKVCLSGASGSGKSSFLNLIMGFIQPDEGEVLVHGEVLNPSNVRQLRRLMTWLPCLTL